MTTFVPPVGQCKNPEHKLKSEVEADFFQNVALYISIGTFYYLFRAFEGNKKT